MSKTIKPSRRIKEEFSVMGIESSAVMLKYIHGINLEDYTPRKLSILGRALLSGIRRARRVITAPEVPTASVITSKELIEESFNTLSDIILCLEEAHDNDEVSPFDKNSIIAFMAEHIKCCSEEEVFRAELEENLTEEEIRQAEEIKRLHDLKYPEVVPEELVLDGFEVKDIIDKII